MVSIGFDKYDKVGLRKRPGRLAGACIEERQGRENRQPRGEAVSSGPGSTRKTRVPAAL